MGRPNDLVKNKGGDAIEASGKLSASGLTNGNKETPSMLTSEQTQEQTSADAGEAQCEETSVLVESHDTSTPGLDAETEDTLPYPANDGSGSTYHVRLIPRETTTKKSWLSYIAGMVPSLGTVQQGILGFYLFVLLNNLRLFHRSGGWVGVGPYLFVLSQVFDNASYPIDFFWRWIIVPWFKSRTLRPYARLVGDDAPGIDLFITCCGEPVDVIVDTVKAACRLDYPPSKLRIIVADDGADNDLRGRLRQIRKKKGNVFYLRRVKEPGKYHGYKAGNLNHGLQWIEQERPGGYGPNPWIGVLDADMIPEPELLRALIPHGIMDDQVALSTVSQHFYNIPLNDPLYQAFTTGTHADDGTRDSVGTAWCPGSGFLLRRSAWKDIGGFPEYSVVEDLNTSWYLHGRGWKTVFVPEVMQWGMQPDCFLTHLKQRRRWWAGHVPDAFRFKFTLWDKRLKKATLPQRVAMFAHCPRPYFRTVAKTSCYLMILYCLFSKQPVIADHNGNALKTVVWLHTAVRVLSFLSGILSTANRWGMRRRVATDIWLGVHFSRDIVCWFLPRCLGGTRPRFEVSGVKEVAQGPVETLKEREASRPGLIERLRILHMREGILYHAVWIAVFAWFFGRAILSHLFATPQINRQFWLNVITSVGYPGLNVIDRIPFFAAPLVYAFNPPVMPKRREMMEFDNSNGTWRPKKEFQKVQFAAKGS